MNLPPLVKTSLTPDQINSLNKTADNIDRKSNTHYNPTEFASIIDKNYKKESTNLESVSESIELDLDGNKTAKDYSVVDEDDTVLYDDGKEDEPESKKDTVVDEDDTVLYDDGKEDEPEGKKDTVVDEDDIVLYDDGKEDEPESKKDTVVDEDDTVLYDDGKEDEPESKKDTVVDEDDIVLYDDELKKSKEFIKFVNRQDSTTNNLAQEDLDIPDNSSTLVSNASVDMEIFNNNDLVSKLRLRDSPIFFQLTYFQDFYYYKDYIFNYSESCGSSQYMYEFLDLMYDYNNECRKLYSRPEGFRGFFKQYIGKDSKRSHNLTCVDFTRSMQEKMEEIMDMNRKEYKDLVQTVHKLLQPVYASTNEENDDIIDSSKKYRYEKSIIEYYSTEEGKNDEMFKDYIDNSYEMMSKEDYKLGKQNYRWIKQCKSDTKQLLYKTLQNVMMVSRYNNDTEYIQHIYKKAKDKIVISENPVEIATIMVECFRLYYLTVTKIVQRQSNGVMMYRDLFFNLMSTHNLLYLNYLHTQDLNSQLQKNYDMYIRPKVDIELDQRNTIGNDLIVATWSCPKYYTIFQKPKKNYMFPENQIDETTSLYKRFQNYFNKPITEGGSSKTGNIIMILALGAVTLTSSLLAK
ncbi:hypothetical protein TetV_453 [Tetraselmis virus 1]|uniref:Uncharacterized protein n=1 Tax=Tetraselmis virus 1 TaxID=2060617 RepID=A0A2P0VNP9_9VIRU|nr:hypothetical protein QJ968_gp601 [Tetraselmis virus 1]AUF82535.1 hypothetical protein TetV_453 [Tetraselmis virus 1]